MHEQPSAPSPRSSADPPDPAGSGDSPAAAAAAGFRRTLFRMVMPLLLLAALTALFRLTAADLAVSRLFYDGAGRVWTYSRAETYPVWDILYRYGPWPGVALGVGGLLAGLASFAWPRWRSAREAGFFLAAMLAVGPGLMINGLVKPWFQRPRPCHIDVFGGDQPFVQVLGRGPDDAPDTVGRSFPSGHASTGFLLMAPAFLLYRRRPRWADAFLVAGLAWGGLLGLGRVAQGDHFASDVLWSGAVVYFSGLVLGHLFEVTTR